ncbi:MAG: hypothetical protein ABUL45_07055, partial [Rhodanobacter sp.]
MNAPTRIDTTRTIRAPRGTELSCKSWLSEAPFRMLQNNLDPEVAENPAELVVYGGIGRAARNWECFDAILKSLRELEDDETLLVQSGKPVGVFQCRPLRQCRVQSVAGTERLQLTVSIAKAPQWLITQQGAQSRQHRQHVATGIPAQVDHPAAARLPCDPADGARHVGDKRLTCDRIQTSVARHVDV